MKTIEIFCKDGSSAEQSAEEIVFDNGSLYLDGEQLVIFSRNIAEDSDFVILSCADAKTNLLHSHC